MSAEDPVHLRVAELVRGQIADGLLSPGQLAPSGQELHYLTGHSVVACRKGLKALVASGDLVRGPSRTGRPRIAGDPLNALPGAGAARELSAALAGLRRRARLTQPGLAALIGVSVTSVGHAETGRLWQSGSFWERADEVLGAGGKLLSRYHAYRQALCAPDPARPAAPPASSRASAGQSSPAAARSAGPAEQ